MSSHVRPSREKGRSLSRRGFTTVELLVIIAVLAILASMVCVGVRRAVCIAREVRLANHASQLDYMLELYAQRHGTRYPGAYPAELEERLAPFLETELAEQTDNPDIFLNPERPGDGPEPLNKSYVTPPPRQDGNRYVLGFDSEHPHVRSAILFSGSSVQLAERLPIQYGSLALDPADVVQGGTVQFATGTRVELGAETLARVIHSFVTEDGTPFHVVKMPRYRHGSLRADVVGRDVVQVVTGAGVVSVRCGVADVDVIPVPSDDPPDEDDQGDDPGEDEVEEDPPPDDPGGGFGDFAIFSETSLDFGGNSSVDHLVGTNGDADLGSTCSMEDMVVGGDLTTGANLTADGDVVANENITLTGNTEVNGNLDCSENVILDGCTVEGTVTAGGPVYVRNATVKGDLFAAGDVTAEANGRVYCDAYYTGPLDAKPKHIGGDAIEVDSIEVDPEVYTPYTLPPPTSFAAGTEDVLLSGGSTQTLSPGHYGDLGLSGGSTVTLSAGKYYFSSILVGGNCSIEFELDEDEGGTDVYVTGNVTTVGGVETVIDGSATASAVYWEVHSDFLITGSATWHGTIYTPYGDAGLGGNSDIYGACYAGGQATLGGNSDLFYFPLDRPIGDPGDDGDDDGDDGDGDGDGDDGDGDGDGDGSLTTCVRVSNHSAAVTVDARSVGRGAGISWIPRRQVLGRSTRARGLARGVSVRVGRWVDVVSFDD